jgi:hypothetical protein
MEAISLSVSEWLLGPVGAIEFHVSFSVLDAARSFGDLPPGVEGLLVAPELEDVDAAWIDRVRANRKIKAAVGLPCSSDHAGERCDRSVALVDVLGV